jgi:8-oxo-dGTP diphosphatase
MNREKLKEIEVVAGIILFQDLILCMQRGKSQFDYVSYKYEFPGGKTEQGESLTEALRRELMEELSMLVESCDETPFMTVKHSYPDFMILLHAFICKTNTQEVTLHEHVNYRWLPKEDLLSRDWAPADLPIVHRLMTGLIF